MYTVGLAFLHPSLTLFDPRSACHTVTAPKHWPGEAVSRCVKQIPARKLSAPTSDITGKLWEHTNLEVPGTKGFVISVPQQTDRSPCRMVSSVPLEMKNIIDVFRHTNPEMLNLDYKAIRGPTPDEFSDLLSFWCNIESNDRVMANPPSEIASVDCRQDIGTEALVVTSVLLSIATVTVALRLYTRKFIRRNLGWDDYFIVASLATGVTAFALYVKLIASGMGRHLICLTLQDISEVAKWSLFAQILIVCTLGLTKVSVCIFVMRVVDKAQRRFTHCLWALIAFIIVSHLVQIILFLAQCRPIEAVWNIFAQGDCFSTRITYISAWVNYSLDASADLLCVGIATYIIQRLQMNMQTKFALCVLMALGLFTAACVVIDAVTLQGVFETDTTWAVTSPAMWAGIGSFVGITIASVPVLKPLFSKVFAIVTLHSSSDSSKRPFRKVIAGAPVAQVQLSPPANIKNSTRRHDLESYNTDVTLTQKSKGTIVEQMDELSIPPLAYYPYNRNHWV